MIRMFGIKFTSDDRTTVVRELNARLATEGVADTDVVSINPHGGYFGVWYRASASSEQPADAAQQLKHAIALFERMKTHLDADENVHADGGYHLDIKRLLAQQRI